MAVFVSRKSSQLWPGRDWAAEHYHPVKLAALRALSVGAKSTVADHALQVRQIETSQSTEEGAYDTGDAISHVLPKVPSQTDERISAKKLASGGDVIISRLRSYLRQAAVIPRSLAMVKLSTEFIVLRSKDADDVWWLLPFMLSEPVQTILNWSQDGNQHPRFDEDVLLRVPVPASVLDKRRQLARAVGEAVSLRDGAVHAIAAAEARLMETLGLDRLDLTPQTCYTRSVRDLHAERRFDAEYFNPKYQGIIKKLRAGGRTLADVASLAERPFDPILQSRGSTFRYIEIGSLTVDGEAEAETLRVADAPSRAAWIVKPGDIITSTVRPVRRLSALVGEDQDGCVCSSGFAVLTPRRGSDGIEPEVLLTYLRLPIICDILDLHCTASMYPAIPVDRLMRIPIAVPDPKAGKAIVAKVQEAAVARRDSRGLLEKAKNMVEDLIAAGSRRKV